MINKIWSSARIESLFRHENKAFNSLIQMGKTGFVILLFILVGFVSYLIGNKVSLDTKIEFYSYYLWVVFFLFFYMDVGEGYFYHSLHKAIFSYLWQVSYISKCQTLVWQLSIWVFDRKFFLLALIPLSMFFYPNYYMMVSVIVKASGFLGLITIGFFLISYVIENRGSLSLKKWIRIGLIILTIGLIIFKNLIDEEVLDINILQNFLVNNNLVNVLILYLFILVICTIFYIVYSPDKLIYSRNESPIKNIKTRVNGRKNLLVWHNAEGAYS